MFQGLGLLDIRNPQCLDISGYTAGTGLLSCRPHKEGEITSPSIYPLLWTLSGIFLRVTSDTKARVLSVFPDRSAHVRPAATACSGRRQMVCSPSAPPLPYSWYFSSQLFLLTDTLSGHTGGR